MTDPAIDLRRRPANDEDGTAAEAPSRDDVAAHFRSVRALSIELASPLSPEDQIIQSMPDVSPTKWHLAHTTWFFETFLLGALGSGYQPVHPAFGYLYNSYYEGVGAFYPRADRGKLSRPSLDEVRAYRAEIDRRMIALIETLDDDAWPLAAERIVLGLHHEQQHQELLLTDIKHVLSLNPLNPAYRDDLAASTAAGAKPRWIEFDGGLCEIGHVGPGFAFDNESPRHKVYIEPFKLCTRLITNGEYMAFIEAGGYQTPQYWLSNGWATVKQRGWSAPFYWRRQADGRWSEFTLAGQRPLDPEAPVCHLSYFEADAFARFVDKRLPTEAEWEVTAAGLPPAGNLMANGHLHPVRADDHGDGPEQMYGDVWEWTSSPYTAYPGYRPAGGAIGEYNGKFMCDQFVLRGGSCLTPPGHVRATYRNFFPADAQWQMTGLRLADDR